MNYKEQIEKIAIAIYRNNDDTLNVPYDDFGDVVDVNPDLWGTNGEYQAWDQAAKDAKNFLNNHTMKAEFIKEDDFNNERDMITDPNAKNKLRNRFLAGTGIGAGVALMSKSPQVAAVAIPAGAIIGAVSGANKQYKMNEAVRNAQVGPRKHEAEKQLQKDFNKEFYGKRYGYDTTYALMQSQRGKRDLIDNLKKACDVVECSFEKVASIKDQIEENNKRFLAKRWGVSEDTITDDDIKALNKHTAENQGKTFAQVYGGLGIGATGATAINHARREGMLDGLVRRYHNTEKENVKGIKDKGILASKAMDENNLTSMTAGLSPSEKEGKTYLAKKRGVARSVGARRHQINSGNVFGDPAQHLLDSFDTQKTIKVNIPLEDYKKMKKVNNPELKGASSLKEALKLSKEGKIPTFDPISTASAYKTLGKDTDTIVGDISSRYIKGGGNYKKQTIKDIAKHIKSNPKTFGKGLGIAGLGAAGIAGGAKLVSKANNNIPENPYKNN